MVPFALLHVIRISSKVWGMWCIGIVSPGLADSVIIDLICLVCSFAVRVEPGPAHRSPISKLAMPLLLSLLVTNSNCFRVRPPMVL